MDVEANLKRLSDEVIFTHEEISRLSAEKDEIVEESESQLLKADARASELEEENKRMRREFRDLWTEFNASLLEKESALESLKRLLSGQPSREQGKFICKGGGACE